MIPPVSFVLVLGSLAAALTVALAAAGFFDRLPPQPYFPAELSRARAINCDPTGHPYLGAVTQTATSEPVINRLRSDWYGSHLRAAREFSLSQPPEGRPAPGAALRFVWLRSFHAPVIVRIEEKAPGAFWLTAKLLGGKGGYGPGGIEKTKVRTLTPDEASAYRRTQARLAGLAPIGCGAGADGAEWIVETRDKGRYGLIRRWSPETGPVRELGELLLGFTGWKLDPIY